MVFVSDILLVAAALGAAVYCLVLSRRLTRLSSIDKGLGGAIAVLSQQVDEMQQALDRARAGSEAAAERLEALTGTAQEVAGELDVLIASCHDLAESAPVARAPAEPAPLARAEADPAAGTEPEVEPETKAGPAPAPAAQPAPAAAPAAQPAPAAAAEEGPAAAPVFGTRRAPTASETPGTAESDEADALMLFRHRAAASLEGRP